MFAFLVIIAGLFLGGLTARLRHENQVGTMMWMAAGAVPGAALMVGAVGYAAVDLVLIPLLLTRATQAS